MTGEFAIAVDHDTGQLTMTGPPTGPAGGAILAPVPGLDLLFDRRSGRLCRLTIDLPDQGLGRGDNEPGRQRMLARLFGAASARAMQRALPAPPRAAPRPGVVAALARLALLDAARATSPVPAASPLWTGEAALLAEQAGLSERAQAEAVRAAMDLAGLLDRMPLPDVLAPVIAAVTRLAGADQPGVVKALRDEVRWFDGSLSAWLAEFGPSLRDPLSARGPGPSAASPRWALDLASAPPGVLKPALVPDADLVARLDDADGLVVEVHLAPGPDPEVLSRCRMRLVDPEDRRIIAQAPLARDGATARARLPVPGGLPELGRAWLDVVADDDVPVRGTTVRTIRQALRWADAALRAERRPLGLAPGFGDERWAGLAGESWQQCRRYWESAGDHERARQVGEPHRPPWPGYLAETVGPLGPSGPGDNDHDTSVTRGTPGRDQPGRAMAHHDDG
jgi:hypothetical protein